jgi:hypothetical protein
MRFYIRYSIQLDEFGMILDCYNLMERMEDKALGVLGAIEQVILQMMIDIITEHSNIVQCLLLKIGGIMVI